MRFILKFSALSLVILLASGAVHAQSWTSQSNMKVKRSEAATADYNGELYVFNGFSKGLSVGASVEKYNPNSKSWTLLGNTSVSQGTGVTHTATVRVGADVWLLGGRVGSHPGRVTDAVWIYNINKKTWRKGPKLPARMAAGGAGLVNNKIYIFGGVDTQAKCDVNHHYVYDLNSTSSGWKNITGTAAMPSPRNHFSTVVLGGKIYAIGGQNGHDGCPGTRGGNVSLVHVFNPGNQKWSQVASLPSAESHNEPSTFVHNGFIYTAGGNSDAKKVVRYDPKSNKWEQVATLPEKLVAPVARIYNGRLVVAGGGAPITSRSKVAVRSLGSSKFNDVANGATRDEPTPEPTPEPKPEPTPEATPVYASTDAVNINGGQLSWPDDGWYQVQNVNGYYEVCAGGRSCEVPAGTYVVINHNTGQRYDGIQVTQTQLSNPNGQTSLSSVEVNGNVISWPDNGWYQVQRADNYSEVCAGGTSCTVSPGKYNVINHNTGIRYDGIDVSGNSSDLSFGEKLAKFESQANNAADTTFLAFNQHYVAGTLSEHAASCIPAQYEGLSIAPVASCDVGALLQDSNATVSQFTYEAQSLSSVNFTFEDDVAQCREALSMNVADACSLSSVSLYKHGLHMQYGTSNRTYTGNRSIIISDDSLDVSGLVLNKPFGEDACFVEIAENEQWSLSHGTNLATCERRLDEALATFNQ